MNHCPREIGLQVAAQSFSQPTPNFAPRHLLLSLVKSLCYFISTTSSEECCLSQQLLRKFHGNACHSANATFVSKATARVNESKWGRTEDPWKHSEGKRGPLFSPGSESWLRILVPRHWCGPSLLLQVWAWLGMDFLRWVFNELESGSPCPDHAQPYDPWRVLLRVRSVFWHTPIRLWNHPCHPQLLSTQNTPDHTRPHQVTGGAGYSRVRLRSAWLLGNGSGPRDVYLSTPSQSFLQMLLSAVLGTAFLSWPQSQRMIHKCSIAELLRTLGSSTGRAREKQHCRGIPFWVTDHARWTPPMSLENSPPVTPQKKHGWNDTGHGTS